MHRLPWITAAALALLAPNAHAQWEIQDAHITADLRGIDYVGNGVAWASGSHGTVLRTEDMGFVWQLCATPPDAKDLDFRGVQAFDNNTALVMSSGPGDKSRLYKTTDGCQTWKLVFINPDKEGFWDVLRFSDAEHGVLIGDPVGGVFPVFLSEDAGNTWKRIDADKLRAFKDKTATESVFAASNSAMLIFPDRNEVIFATGGTQNFLRSLKFVEGDGAPFCKQSCMIEGGARTQLAVGATAGAFSMAERSDGTLIVIVGGDYKLPSATTGVASVCAFKTLGPLSKYDCRPPVTPPHGYRGSVAYDAAANTWITVGPNGTDVSTDDGRNWRPLHPGPDDTPDADRDWNALSLPFVVGPKGRVGILRDVALRELGATATAENAKDARAALRSAKP